MGDRVFLVVGGVAGLPLEGSNRLVQKLPQQINDGRKMFVALLFIAEFQSALIHSFRLALFLSLCFECCTSLFQETKFFFFAFWRSGSDGDYGKSTKIFPALPNDIFVPWDYVALTIKIR